MDARSADSKRPEDVAAPGSLMTPRQIKYLKAAIAIMTTLLVIGIFLLIYKVVVTAREIGATPETTAAKTVRTTTTVRDQAALRAAYASQEAILYAEGFVSGDAEVVSSTLDGDRLVLTLREAGGLTLLSIDMKAWKITGVMRLTPKESAQ